MKSEVTHLVSHCSMPGCSFVFVDTKILSTHRCKVTGGNRSFLYQENGRCMCEPGIAVTMENECISEAVFLNVSPKAIVSLGT